MMTESDPIYTTIKKANNGRHANDLYPTDAAVTQILLDRVPQIRGVACEPASGPGVMAEELQRSGRVSQVWTNDIDIRWHEHTDFLSDAGLPEAMVWAMDGPERPYDWVITNPPFNQAMPILRQAWSHARVGVAFLLRLTFLEPSGKRSDYRGDWLNAHADQMSHLIVFGQPRPSFTGNGKTDSVTTAWMVWQKEWSWKRLGLELPFNFATHWQ
ncbi:MAG: hypothetical protein GY803_08060 [Chloroflexi bacterium]|nr:hypothetical protein [Chloroflexota bacterium]